MYDSSMVISRLADGKKQQMEARVKRPTGNAYRDRASDIIYQRVCYIAPAAQQVICENAAFTVYEYKRKSGAVAAKYWALKHDDTLRLHEPAAHKRYCSIPDLQLFQVPE